MIVEAGQDLAIGEEQEVGPKALVVHRHRELDARHEIDAV
jgi:hypothetical protein